MARALEGEVEFGAVNCVNEPDLQKKFALTAFPSFFLVAPELGFQLQVWEHFRPCPLLYASCTLLYL